MSASIPRKFRRGDTSPEHLGRVFYQYKLGKEYWVTPEVFEKSDALRKKLINRWQKANREKCREATRRWGRKPGNLQIKRQAYRNWIKSPEARVIKRQIHRRFLSTVNGMITTWKNWSKWEIDHRVPLSSFNLADPEQQKLAFNYHNCRPMWKEANRQKSDKIEGELFRGREIRKVIPFKAA